MWLSNLCSCQCFSFIFKKSFCTSFAIYLVHCTHCTSSSVSGFRAWRRNFSFFYYRERERESNRLQGCQKKKSKLPCRKKGKTKSRFFVSYFSDLAPRKGANMVSLSFCFFFPTVSGSTDRVQALFSSLSQGCISPHATTTNHPSWLWQWKKKEKKNCCDTRRRGRKEKRRGRKSRRKKIWVKNAWIFPPQKLSGMYQISKTEFYYVVLKLLGLPSLVKRL